MGELDNSGLVGDAGALIGSAKLLKAEISRRENRRMWNKLVVGEVELDDIMARGERVVFMGGACNFVDENGQLQRNTDRDKLNAMLSDAQIWFFDPQIHHDTHGREYDWIKDGNAEKKAMDYSKVDLIEIRPDTFGGVSMLELLRDGKGDGKERIVWMSGGSDRFEPNGIDGNAKDKHLAEYQKNGYGLRRDFLKMLDMEETKASIRFTGDGGFPDNLDNRDGVRVFKISKSRIHGADILEAFSAALNGEQIEVWFEGNRDQKGNPVFESDGDLEKYMKEGNDMRVKIKELMGEDSGATIVKTEADAFKALKQALFVGKSTNTIATPDVVVRERSVAAD